MRALLHDGCRLDLQTGCAAQYVLAHLHFSHERHDRYSEAHSQHRGAVASVCPRCRNRVSAWCWVARVARIVSRLLILRRSAKLRAMFWRAGRV